MSSPLPVPPYPQVGQPAGTSGPGEDFPPGSMAVAANESIALLTEMPQMRHKCRRRRRLPRDYSQDKPITHPQAHGVIYYRE